MATTDSGDKITALDELEMVVDADSHFTETIGDILPYVDESRHRAAKELMEASELKLNEIYSLTVASPGFAYASQDTTIEDSDEATAAEGHVEEKLATMEEHGITHSVIGPTLNLTLASVNNSRFAVALANAYNSWVLDILDGAPENLKATILVPPQKPSKAAEEIDARADNDRFVAVELVASGLVPPPGHEWYNPIYQAAEDNDLPISMHSSVGQTPLTFPVQYKWNETFAADHAIGHPFSHMWNLTSMLFEGVPERYDLEFVFKEAGIGYVPYMMGRLDDHYLEMSYELPALEKLPSEYIQNQFYFTTQPLELTPRNPQHIAHWVEMAGEETIMYSGDFPHPDFDPPEELFDRVCRHFDGETTEKLMGKTAADVFDLTA